MQNSKLLFDKSPLLINPDLATLIGLSESIVIQQVHYWIKTNEEANRNFYDGHFWTYNTYAEWQKQFPFWSESAVQKIFLRLEKQGYLISGNYNKLKFDRTKWYRINYDKLQMLDDSPSCTKSIMEHSQKALPIPETTTKNNKKINKGNFKEISMYFSTFAANYPDEIENPDEIIPAVEYYLDKYREYMGQYHPALKVKQWQTVINNILAFDERGRIGLEEIEKIIDKHFVTEYENCDYNILHFVNGDIIKHRFYEECL